MNKMGGQLHKYIAPVPIASKKVRRRWQASPLLQCSKTMKLEKTRVSGRVGSTGRVAKKFFGKLSRLGRVPFNSASMYVTTPSKRVGVTDGE
jgi:hypothetical protein